MMDRGAHSRKNAAAWLDIGVDHFDAHVRPHVKAVYLGDKTLYPTRELQRFLDERLA